MAIDAKQEGDNISKKVYVIHGRNVLCTNFGGVSITSRNGAPSRKRCMVTGQTTTASKTPAPPPPYPQNSPFNSRKSIQRRPPRLLWGSRSWLSLRLWCRPRSTPRRSPSSTSPPPPPSTAPGESPSPSCSYRRQTPVQPTAGFLALGLDRLRQVLPSTEGVDREYNLSCLGSLERI